jgi:hypothetical protein
VLQKQGRKDKKTLQEERGNFEVDCLHLALCVLCIVMDFYDPRHAMNICQTHNPEKT